MAAGRHPGARLHADASDRPQPCRSFGFGVHPGRPKPPGAPHAGVVHAPGRTCASRVPRSPRRGHDPQRDRRRGPGHRDHPAARAPLRSGRRDPVLRHHDPGARHRLRRRHRTGCRAGRRAALPEAADLERLRPLDPEADTPYVLETVTNLVRDLPVPLIAFAGAPFTVASYLLEGRPTRTWTRTKALMHTDEAALARLDGSPGRPRHRIAAFAGRRPAHRRSSCSTRGWARCRLPTTSGSCCRRSARGFSPRWPTSGCPGSTSGSTPVELRR